MNIKHKHRMIRRCLASIIIGVIISFPTVATRSAYADYPRLINRSLSVGTTLPGATTDYTFRWEFPVATTVRSIRLLLCSDPYVEDACSNTPSGDMSNANLSGQTGVVTGFNILSQDSDEIIITRAASAAGTGLSTYVFSDIQNPSGLPETFFVQIFTYPTADATGAPNYMSSVANATTEPIVINTEVPPILYFCAALTIEEWCENVNGNFVDYGDLTPYVTEVAVSQFGVATNASGGYVVTVNGNTMTSGNKIIDAISTPAANTPGIAQFGLNLRANTNPASGQDVFGTGVGTVAADYNTPDLFKFNDGDIVASAVTGSMFNTFTVTYIVNIDPDQLSGVYNTTIAYICTAAF